MTYEQTREQFLLALNSNAYLNMCTSDDMKNAIYALNKQIPMKPNKVISKILIGEGWTYKCPTCLSVCGENKYYPEVTNEEHYCGQCGQKLDW